MKIVADSAIHALDETFARHGTVVRKRGGDITRADLVDADALVVRTITRVDADLLDGTPVRFVGTATIGTDHLDIDWLDAEGIAWSSAPGCNADAAAQYTLAMMMLACRRMEIRLVDQQVGIVGLGNVGSRLQALLNALGIPVLACDPPLEDAGTRGLVPLEEALACSMVSLHVPLTRGGAYPTLHMIGAAQLARMPTGSLLVNASRGDVIEASALSSWLQQGGGQAALDVWPGEPAIDPALLAACVVGTPHVAGYSREGKLRGSRMVYEAYCRAFELPAVPAMELPPMELDIADGDAACDCTALAQSCVLAVCGVVEDDEMLRATHTVATAFETLRANYRVRREFRSIQPGPVNHHCAPLLRALGFTLPHPGE